MMETRILIVDDDIQICDRLCRYLQQANNETDAALTLDAGLAKAQNGQFDIIILSASLPDGNGLSVIEQLKVAPGRPEVIILTAPGDLNAAEQAVRNGAWDYFEKPLQAKTLVHPVSRIMQYRRFRTEEPSRAKFTRTNIIGSSPEIEKSINLAAEAAASKENVLIMGQTGTGKELFARAIHENSDRSTGPFVVLDCTVIPQNLVGSTLFGHRKGAFTGADRPQTGLIGHAHKGTLFLDEIGELPMDIQGSLLRVLQERRFRPLGESREIPSDFRLISATNRDLAQMVEKGSFRQDIYFRIRSLEIPLPPLRFRSGDCLEIALVHLNQLCERYGTATKGMSPEFCDALASYGWPGNVRELLSALERALVSSRHAPVLYPKHLPISIRVNLARESSCRLAAPGLGKKNHADLPLLKEYRQALLSEAEKNYLYRLMETTRGEIGEACRISGISQSRLYHLLKTHRISRSKIY